MSATLPGSPDVLTSNETSTAFHVGLNVNDLERSVQFYCALFDCSPSRHFADYARFELTEPFLVLALYPSPQEPGGALNHIGLRFRSSEELIAVQYRLEKAGISTQRQDDVECCYARQSKFWVTDPDRNLWEIYVVDEDLDHSGFDDAPATKAQPQLIWEHRLSEPIPNPLPQADNSLDEIRLEGTLNSLIPQAEIDRLLQESVRVLRPGGRIVIHGLVGDRPFPGTPRLLGMAALVQRVPVETEAATMLELAGFVDLFLDKQGDIHCFQVAGVQLRELRISGIKPAVASDGQVPVIYKGPFAEVELENGVVLRRGEVTMLSKAVAERLSTGQAADSIGLLQDSTGTAP